MTRQSRRLLAGTMLMLLAQLAHAQYAWIDDKGTRVFSDRPPPPGTPAARIIKGPRPAAQAGVPPGGDPGAVSAAAGPAAAGPSAAGPAASAAPTAPKPPSLAEQDAAFRQRHSRREEDARKAQEAEQTKRDTAERCAAARQESLQLASGMRIAQVDAKGERSFMTDAERTRRQAAAQGALHECR